MVRTALISLVFGMLGALLGVGVAVKGGWVFPHVPQWARVDVGVLIDEQVRAMASRRDGTADAGEAARAVERAIRSVVAERGGETVVLLSAAVVSPGSMPDLTEEVRGRLGQ